MHAETPAPRFLRLAPFVILACAVGVYLNTLTLGFAWDDTWLILENPRISDPGYARDLLLEGKLWRPLKRLSFMADYALWGPSRPAGFHATNVVLHALCCLLLYAVGLRLGLGRAGATAGGLLFAVHPVHVEAVANISGRKEPLALLFCLAAFWAWLAARPPSPEATETSRLRGPALGLLAALCYLLAMLSKEAAAVMLPACIVVHTLLLDRNARRGRLRQLALLLGLLALVLLVFSFRGYVGSIAGRFNADQIEWVTQGETSSYGRLPLTALKAFGFYARILFWPVPLYADHDFTLASSITEPGVLLGLALLALLVTVALWAARRKPLVSLGLVWYALNLLPFLNVVPLTTWLVAERFVYLPSAGMALVAGVVVDRLWHSRESSRTPGRRRLAVGLTLGGVLCILAGLTWRQNTVWKNDEALWRHTLAHNPDSYMAWYGLGAIHASADRLEEAEQAYRRSLAISPRYAATHYGLASLLLRLGRHDEAVEHAGIYASTMSDQAAPWVVIGNARFHQGRLDEAVAAYREAMSRDPTYGGLRFNLANALNAAGVYDEALEVLGRTPEPQEDVRVHLLRGLLLERHGDREGALESYRLAHEAAPEAAGPHTAAGLLLLRQRRLQEAREELSKSLELEPNQPAVHKLLEQIPDGS